MEASHSTSSFSDSAPRGDSANGSGRPAKRQKVAVACDECRTKKVKCDGSRPVCRPCANRYGQHAECQWGAQKVRSSGVSKQDLSRLENRIKELESGKNQVATRDSDVAPAQRPPAHCQVTNRENSVSAMMGISPEEESQGLYGHFGDSSASSFMNQVKMAIDKQVQSPDMQRPPGSVTAQVQRSLLMSRSKGQRPSLDYVLPPRKKADELLETYWRLVHPLYPFLDKEEIMSAYRCLWTGEGPGYDEPTFLCLLNVAFCFACVLGESIRPEERSASAEVFFVRARELLDFDLVQRASVLTVQCFLILGQYLQSTNDSQQCWIVVGLALRIAQSLGLHLPSTTSHIQDIQKRDMLRRVWHGCVLMDRALSMTFGRPAMISTEAAASVPPPLAHEDITTCGCSGATFDRNEAPYDLHFFLESIKLYEILNEILLTLYTPSPCEASTDDPYEIYFGGSNGKQTAAIFDLDRKLLHWTRGLPSHLKYDQNAEKHPVHTRQANVLWLRFRHIRILLFRPTLSLFCMRHDKPAATLEDAMPERIALQCSVMCVNIAQEVIEFFRSKLEALPDQTFDALLPAWWYNVFYVYTAATVLVAARFHPSITAEISNEAITAAWQGAIDSLTRFEAFSKNAKRCAAALKILFDKVSLQHHQQQQSGPQQSNPQYVDAAAVPLHTANPNTLAWSGDQIYNPGPNNPHPAISITENFLNVASTTNFFDNTDFSFDLNDMSWLSSVPFQLYNN